MFCDTSDVCRDAFGLGVKDNDGAEFGLFQDVLVDEFHLLEDREELFLDIQTGQRFVGKRLKPPGDDAE